MPLGQSVAIDSVSATIVVGEGSSGTNSGGVLSVQGAGVSGIQLPARDVINVGSQYRAQSVTTSAAQALGAGSILANRKFISITPTNGTIFYGTNNSVTTTTGAPLFANQTLTVSFTDNVQLWVIAATTTDLRVLEGS